MGFENIVEARGFGIAATGLLIVFVALTLISAFIALLPRAMELLSSILPEEADTHSSRSTQGRAEEELVAAIGFALHQRGRNTPRD